LALRLGGFTALFFFPVKHNCTQTSITLLSAALRSQS
jgi:hypothetical protein